MRFITVLTSGSGVGPNLADGNALYSTAHKNLTTSSALSYDNARADRVAFMKKNGFGPDAATTEFLGLMPKFLITSVDNLPTAEDLALQEYAPGTGGTSGASMLKNTLRGTFTPLASARLGTTNRRWWLANPADAAVYAMYFLDGKQTPWIDKLTNNNPMELEWQVTMPGVGCAVVGHEGGLCNAGG